MKEFEQISTRIIEEQQSKIQALENENRESQYLRDIIICYSVKYNPFWIPLGKCTNKTCGVMRRMADLPEA